MLVIVLCAFPEWRTGALHPDQRRHWLCGPHVHSWVWRGGGRGWVSHVAAVLSWGHDPGLQLWVWGGYRLSLAAAFREYLTFTDPFQRGLLPGPCAAPSPWCRGAVSWVYFRACFETALSKAAPALSRTNGPHRKREKFGLKHYGFSKFGFIINCHHYHYQKDPSTHTYTRVCAHIQTHLYTHMYIHTSPLDTILALSLRDGCPSTS